MDNVAYVSTLELMGVTLFLIQSCTVVSGFSTNKFQFAQQSEKWHSHSTVPLSSSARGWVDRINSIFRNEIAINIDHLPPVCVFEVPKVLSAQSSEAYTPQLIALGPYHHLRPELYQMERYKLAAIKHISTPEQMSNFHELVINKLKEKDPCTRACYNKFLEYDQDSLAWIIAIDACFLLNLFRSYLYTDDASHRRLLNNTIITRDIFMLENQIPHILLKEICKCLNLCSSDDRELMGTLLDMCEAHSPVKFSIERKDLCNIRPLHLLDLMHHLIVYPPASVGSFVEENSIEEVSIYVSSTLFSSSSPSLGDSDEDQDPGVLKDNAEAIMDLVDSLGNKHAKNFLRPVKVISNLPWSRISGLLRKGTLHDGDKHSSDDEEIAIPSVSYLWRYAKVKCCPITGGISNIKFVEEDATLCLPVLNLNASSEVILRNLVAYEAAMPKSNLEFAQYINLMNGITDTAEDVNLLRRNGVVKGALTDDETAALFNGMKRFYVRLDQSSNITSTIEKVNRYFDKRFGARLFRQMKKHFYSSWRSLAVISTILVFVLFSLQSFCQIYRCSRFWGGKINGFLN